MTGWRRILTAHGVPVKSRVVLGERGHAIKEIIEQEKCDLVVLPHWQSGAAQRFLRVFSPSVLEDATCPVLVLKGSRWLTESRAPREGPASPAQGS